MRFDVSTDTLRWDGRQVGEQMGGRLFRFFKVTAMLNSGTSIRDWIPGRHTGNQVPADAQLQGLTGIETVCGWVFSAR